MVPKLISPSLIRKGKRLALQPSHLHQDICLAIAQGRGGHNDHWRLGQVGIIVEGKRYPLSATFEDRLTLYELPIV